MTFVCLLGVFIIGEFVTNYSEFMSYRDRTENFGQVMAAYYGARFPMFFDTAGHIVALLASMLVISWMKQHNELTALQAAGISRLRVVRPLLISAGIIAALGVANREFGLPRLRHLLVSSVPDIIKDRPQQMTPHHDFLTDILFDGDSVTSSDQCIENARLLLPFKWKGVGYKLGASEAHFHPASEGRPSGYLLSNVIPNVATIESVRSEKNEPIILTPRDHQDLKSNQCFVVSDLKPELLRGNHRWQQYASTTELISHLRDASVYHPPGIEIKLHSRFVRPFLDVALFLCGLPIVLNAERRQVFVGAAKGLLVVGAFALTTLVCHAMGVQLVLKPALAAWLPLLVLGPFAVLFSGPLTA